MYLYSISDMKFMHGHVLIGMKRGGIVGSLSSVAAKALRLLTADRDVAHTSVCERHTLSGLTPPPTKSKDEIASYSMIKLSEETQA